MIFLVVGTQKFQLNRLLKEVDNLIDEGIITEKVFAQTGNSDYQPKNYDYEPFIAKEQFEKLVAECDLLITHSGVATIMSGINHNKKTIVYPRLSKFNEHIDDHQLEIAKSFSEQNYVLLCGENDNLKDIIEKAMVHKFSEYVSQREEIVNTVRSFISGDYVKKIKVLVISTVYFIENGITSVIMNYYENMHDNNIQMDFVAINEVSQEFKDKIIPRGSNIYSIDRKGGTMKYMRELKKLIKKNKYDIVHAHGNSATMLVDLLPAKLAGVKVRISHSHNTTCKNMKVHKLFNPFFQFITTHRLACGVDAGNWLFKNKNFTVLNNSINLTNFEFNENIRNEYRQKLGVGDKKVIGHVGRFNEQKNHKFLIDSFAQLLKKDKNCVLLLIGAGIFEEEMREKVKTLNIGENVIFLGVSNEVNKYLQTMDVFALPSLYEGLVVVMLEAQASGLPCICSDTVTKEAEMSDCVRFIPIDSHNLWAENMLGAGFNNSERAEHSKKAIKILSDCGYDIKRNAEELEKYYKKALQK